MPAPQTIHAGVGSGSRLIWRRIDSAMLLLPRQSVARSASANWSRWQAPIATCRRANQASEIAVVPEDTSTTHCPGLNRPLHSAYRNSERAVQPVARRIGLMLVVGIE